jgi:hypothetical protein
LEKSEKDSNYVKVALDDSRNYKTTHVKLSGATTHWHKAERKDGEHKEEALIYIPGIRLAGTKENLKHYLAEIGFDKMANELLASAFTPENYENNTKKQTVYSIRREQGKNGSTRLEFDTFTKNTFKQNYEEEISNSEEADKASKHKTEKRNDEIKQLLEFLKNAHLSSETTTSSATHHTASPHRTRAPKGKALEPKSGHYFNVTKLTEALTGARNTKERPVKHAVFLDDQVYFMTNTKPGTPSGAEGALHYLRYRGFTVAEAKKKIHDAISESSTTVHLGGQHNGHGRSSPLVSSRSHTGSPNKGRSRDNSPTRSSGTHDSGRKKLSSKKGGTLPVSSTFSSSSKSGLDEFF